MDQSTLEAHQDLAVQDPSPTTAKLTRLTAAEQSVYATLQDSGLRLEQERIPWPQALAAIPFSASSPPRA
jgi:hypothetical protein